MGSRGLGNLKRWVRLQLPFFCCAMLGCGKQGRRVRHQHRGQQGPGQLNEVATAGMSSVLDAQRASAQIYQRCGVTFCLPRSCMRMAAQHAQRAAGYPITLCAVRPYCCRSMLGLLGVGSVSEFVVK